MRNNRQTRIVSSIFYLIAIFAVQLFVIGSGFPIDQRSLWLFNGVASLILGSRIVNPHFVPPVDILTNSFLAGATMLAAIAAKPTHWLDLLDIWVVFSLCAVCFLASLLLMLIKRRPAEEARPWVLTSEAVLRRVGAPTVIYTIVILCLAWVFHRRAPQELFAILAAWTIIVALDPVEMVIELFLWARKKLDDDPPQILGVVAAHQTPGIVLIRQNDDVRYPVGTLMALSDDKGPTTLGIALNYVGRDDGVLLRAISTKVPPAIKAQVQDRAEGAQLAVKLDIEPDEEAVRQSMVLERISTLCGIVDSGSNVSTIEVELVDEIEIAEGRLVEVKVGKKNVLYQVINGVTHEDSIQQKNKYGYVRAAAQKIGVWDPEKRKFSASPWVPRINSPVFLKASDDYRTRKDAIGHFPDTDFEVSLNVSEAVTHNTAILGILGIGKSYLAIEILERMIADDVKVIALDLTDQYSELLDDFYSKEFHAEVVSELEKAAEGRPVKPGKDDGGSIGAFTKACNGHITTFLSDECAEKLLILNPAQFKVSRQTTNAYNNQAGFADLTPSEITAIISDAALNACQSLGMTDKARACLVYEEAHSLVPEWNSVASDGDKHATAISARAILQGRKFGLGCLLITQRTANVTKTILNQCNTIFAMRTFDDTGKDFLGNYIGSQYASVLPSLKDRHAVFFGKASSCDDPVLIRLNDRKDFIEAFREAVPEEAAE